MEIIATQQHRSNYPNPISFSPGDRLNLGARDQEYVGWIWVKTLSGKEGWAPEQFIDRQSSIEGVACESYSAYELDTVQNERLLFLMELNGWLWVKNSVEQCGWVPIETTDYQCRLAKE